MVVEELVGHKVLYAHNEAGGTFLTFSDGSRISIFNRLLSAEAFVEAYIGETIVSVKFDDINKYFCIKFRKCKPLSVDLHDDAFNGPEAIIIARGKDILVFN